VIARMIAIFAVAAIGELSGTYAVWRWLKAGGPLVLAFAGVAALFGYAVVQTLQPETRYGRVYAAYAGVFLVGAMLWGWLVDRKTPDRFDVVGASVALVGVTIVLFGRRLFV
jgi:small multidrug resistance family-3 protein